MIRALLILAVLAPAAAQAQDATPVKRQAVSYPPMAAQFGVSARCAMTFDVNGEGGQMPGLGGMPLGPDGLPIGMPKDGKK